MYTASFHLLILFAWYDCSLLAGSVSPGSQIVRGDGCIWVMTGRFNACSREGIQTLELASCVLCFACFVYGALRLVLAVGGSLDC
jgi:hypothetical protein